LKKKTIFSALKIILFLSIGVFFIWFFLKDLTPSQKDEIIESFKTANYWWLVLSLVFGLLSHVLRTLRWQMLIEPIGYKTKFWNTFFAVMIGYFANLALPRLGEVTRCGILTKYDKVPFNKSFGTVVTERILDLIMFFILFFVNLYIQYDLLYKYVQENFFSKFSEKFSSLGNGSFIFILTAIAVFIIVMFFVFRKKLAKSKLFNKVKNILLGFWQGLKSLTQIKKPFLFIFYTLAIWFCYLMMVYVCFFSISATGHLGIEPAFSALLFGTIGIMVVQGGIGIYPFIIAGALTLYNVSETSGYALGWIAWSSQEFAIILSGIVSLILLPIINNNSNGKNRFSEEKNIQQ
jgi:uncharacterized protein (TIRG00374 family)